MARVTFSFEEDDYGYMLTCFVLCTQNSDKCKELVGPFTIKEAQNWSDHHQTEHCEHELLYPNIGYSRAKGYPERVLEPERVPQ